MKLPIPKKAIGVALKHPVDRVAAALERNAHDVGAGFRLEGFDEQLMRNGGGRVAQRLRMRLGIRGELFERTHLERGRDGQALRDHEQRRDRLQILEKIVVEGAEDMPLNCR